MAMNVMGLEPPMVLLLSWVALEVGARFFGSALMWRLRRYVLAAALATAGLTAL